MTGSPTRVSLIESSVKNADRRTVSIRQAVVFICGFESVRQAY